MNDQVSHIYYYCTNFGLENRARRECFEALEVEGDPDIPIPIYDAFYHVCYFLPWILINYPSLFDQTSR